MSETGNERVAILVHEVRSPVAALAAIAEAIGEGSEPAVRRELVRLAVGACEAIERIVGDITITSVRLALVDPVALVHDVLATHGAGAEVDVTVAEGLSSLEGDPVRLRQAVDNLVTNAMLHGEGRSVAIHIGRLPGAVSISVADQGGGIPADELERIFERGARVEESRSGSGLGLYVARAIVEAHDGVLEAQSVLGHGATFTITLPAAQSDT